MDPLHIKFLKELEKSGLGNGITVSDFIVHNFDKQDHNLIQNWSGNQDPAMYFIQNLADRRHVLFDWNLCEKDLYEKSESTQDYYWFDSFPLMARITVEGLDYLDSYRALATQRRSNIAAMWSFGTTLLITSLTLFVTILTYNITKKQAEDIRQIKVSIDTLSLQPIQKELRILHQSIPVASGKDSYYIKPPSVINRVRKTK